ncbi:MAG: molybdenum cofactor guanylyltransferase [Magnetococcales bacterium]|nr:molybdenum cofactor guanylyltransferase [Magnetococcales bacterium]
MKPDPLTITGLILAGGRSRRMGATDKAFIELAKRPMLAHVLDRLEPQVAQVVISSNEDPACFSPFQKTVIADGRGGFQGPLAGIEAAFMTLDTDWLLSVPVDTPFFPKDLAGRMCQAAQNESLPVVAESDNRLHPVITLWPRSVLPFLIHSLDTQQLKLHDWFAKQKHHRVVFDRDEQGNDPFFNVNRPEDLALAEQRIRRHPAGK